MAYRGEGLGVRAAPKHLLRALTVVAGFFAVGCNTERFTEPLLPPRDPPRTISSAVYSSERSCGLVTVQIGTNDQVTATFPTLSGGCSLGLALVSGGQATYQKTGRKLTLPVVARNGGPDTGQPPIQVVLPKDSAVVTAPSNVSGSATPSNADSTAPAGRPDAGSAFWRVGTTALGPNQSTLPRALTFSLPAKATGLRLAFVVRAVLPDTARPLVPASWTEVPDLAVSVLSPMNTSVRYYRNRFILAFDPAASGPTVRDLFARYNATVVGGVPSYSPRGAYVISTPDPGTDPLAWKDLYDRLTAEPSIELAIGLPVGTPMAPRSRFPDDGPGLQRNDWMTRSSTVAPWLAIRAPQAWGCETGTYTPARVKVGVIDNVFDTQGSDFARSTLTFEGPAGVRPNALGGYSPYWKSHGTAVTSLFVARGDNASGTAGMLWGADLTHYAFSTGTDLTTQTELHGLYHVQHATTTGVRILLQSDAFGDITNAPWQQVLERAFSNYLATGGHWVLATGNDSRTMSLASLKTTQDTVLRATDAIAARLYDLYPNQVHFVVASDRAGGLWSYSNFWTGGVQVAAPGVQIRVRARTADFPAGYYDDDGTSYAAPFVAGLIGQLLSMNPALTPSEVADYLLRGAQQPRRDSLTGTTVNPQPIANVPGGATVFQIDAYGSLSLLAQEKPDMPVCGYPVSASQIDLGAIFLEKPSGAVRVTVQNVTGQVLFPSVAPGGRAIAVQARGDNSPDAVLHTSLAVINPRGERLATVNPLQALWREYFDRGYTDFYYSTYVVGSDTGLGLNFKVTGQDGAPSYGWQQLRDGAGNVALWPRQSGGWSPPTVDVSPGGNYIAFVHLHWPAVGNSTDAVRYVQPVAGGSTISLGSEPFTCPPDQTGTACWTNGDRAAAWSPSGASVILGWKGTLWRYGASYNSAGPWTFNPVGSTTDAYNVWWFFYVTPDEALVKHATGGIPGNYATVTRPLSGLNPSATIDNSTKVVTEGP